MIWVSDFQMLRDFKDILISDRISNYYFFIAIMYLPSVGFMFLPSNRVKRQSQMRLKWCMYYTSEVICGGLLYWYHSAPSSPQPIYPICFP